MTFKFLYTLHVQCTLMKLFFTLRGQQMGPDGPVEPGADTVGGVPSASTDYNDMKMG